MSALRECVRAFADVLRCPNLRRAQLSSVALWSSEFAFITALGVYAFREGGAGAVGLVGFVRLLPAALALPFAGALVDRMRREQLLVAASLVRTVAVGLAAAAAAIDAPAATVYVLAVVATAAFTVYRPAHSALLPSLCSAARDLTSANVVRSALDAASALVAPLVAGGLLAVSSVAVAFAATALVSLYGALAVARLSYEAPPLEPRGERRVLAEVLEGFRYLPGNGHAALLIALTAAQAFVRGALTVFVVVVALELLESGEGGVGVLWAAFGAGGLVAAFAGSLLLGSRRMGAFFGVGMVLWGLPIAAISGVPSPVPTIGLLALVGAGNALMDVTVDTLLPRLVPDRILGRTLCVAETAWTFAMAAGSLVAPLVIWALGIHGALLTVGALLPALVLLSWNRLRRIDAEVEIRDDEITLLRRVPLLRPLPVPAMEHLALKAQPVQAATGELVFGEGDPGDRFYVIATGEAEVCVRGNPIAVLGPGESFGEIALLRSVPRTATVRALSELDMRALDAATFVPSVSGYSASAGNAEIVMTQRLAGLPA